MVSSLSGRRAWAKPRTIARAASQPPGLAASASPSAPRAEDLPGLGRAQPADRAAGEAEAEPDEGPALTEARRRRAGRRPPRRRRTPPAGRSPVVGSCSVNSWTRPATTEIHAASATITRASGTTGRRRAIVGRRRGFAAELIGRRRASRRSATAHRAGHCARRTRPPGHARRRRPPAGHRPRRRPDARSLEPAQVGHERRRVAGRHDKDRRPRAGDRSDEDEQPLERRRSMRRQPREEIEDPLDLSGRGRDRDVGEPRLGAGVARRGDPERRALRRQRAGDRCRDDVQMPRPSSSSKARSQAGPCAVWTSSAIRTSRSRDGSNRFVTGRPEPGTRSRVDPPDGIARRIRPDAGEPRRILGQPRPDSLRAAPPLRPLELRGGDRPRADEERRRPSRSVAAWRATRSPTASVTGPRTNTPRRSAATWKWRITRSNGASVQKLRSTPAVLALDEVALPDDDAVRRLVVRPQPGERQALAVPDLDRRAGSRRPTSSGRARGAGRSRRADRSAPRPRGSSRGGA